MPGQTTQSSVLAKLAGKINPAAKKHAEDEVDFGFSRVPAGITGGVARLTECKFDVYKTGNNTGQPYFRAAGVVVEPAHAQGCQTSIMVGLVERKRKDQVTGREVTVPIEEAVVQVQNEMKKLGATGATMQDANGLERTAALLKKIGPYFKFDTSVRKALNPGDADGVWENWRGMLKDYTPPEVNGVNDNTGDADEPPADEPSGDEGDTGAGPGGGFDETSADVDSLVEAAGNGDKRAEARITEMARAAGVTDEEITAADSWQAVVDLMNERRGEDSGAASPGSGAPEPKKDEVCRYKFPGQKRSEDCNIDAVSTKNKTVNLTSLADKKRTAKAVKWDDIDLS